LRSGVLEVVSPLKEESMNKSDLVKKVADKTELSHRDASASVNAVLDAVKDALGGGEKVTLVGFGTFGVKQRQARKGKHPRTGKSITIPAKSVPYFSSGKELRDAAAGGKKKAAAAPKKAPAKKKGK
jgi:DNA-binding protein HU-beta